MLQFLTDPVIAIERDGTIRHINAAAATLLELSAEAAIGMPARELVEAPWDRVIERGAPISRPEVVFRNRLFVENTLPLRDGEAIAGAAIVLHDISAHRIGLRRAELAERLAIGASSAAALAHQINNPLAVVLVHAEFVREEVGKLRAHLPADTPLIRELEEAGREIERAATEVSKITADLRMYSAIPPASGGESDLKRTLNWVLRSASPELRDRARWGFHTDIDQPIALDPPRLGQLFQHLIANAAAAIQPGAAEANEISILARRIGDDRAAISVRDTGIGIPPAILATIFTPSFVPRASGVEVRLGLSTCHAIVTSVGGSIDIESTSGRGTIVHVTLPLVRAVADAEPRARVLVLDEDEASGRSVRRVLRDHDVTICTTLEDALAELGRTPTGFDVMFAELEGLGTDLYERLLVDYPAIARRLVFVAMSRTDGRVGEFLAATNNKWIDKAISPAELRALVLTFVTR